MPPGVNSDPCVTGCRSSSEIRSTRSTLDCPCRTTPPSRSACAASRPASGDIESGTCSPRWVSAHNCSSGSPASSGGQLQRVGIARALSVNPDVLVLDEPVSALGVSIQAQILNLLRDLQARRDLAYLFISHDMSVVRYLCHRVAVMYLGRIVEVATTDEIFESPAHPYTKVMLAAIPDTDCSMSDMGQPGQTGEEAGAAMEFGGCRFMPRCPAAVDECAH